MLAVVRRWARMALTVVAWLYLGALFVQVLLAGVGLFVSGDAFALHRDVGWIIHLIPIPIVILAALARAPRNTVLLSIVLFGVAFIQPILVTFRGQIPIVAAFHPPVALVIFAMASVLAFQTLALVRRPPPATPPAQEPIVGG